MATTLTADDPRYSALFDVAKEAAESGSRVEGDLSPAMNALRGRGAALQGGLRELLDLPEVHMAFDRPRPHYSLMSFELVERAFRENLVFSSEVYLESPGVRSFGNNILQMTGDEHRRYRSVVQPKFLKHRAQSWWRTNWIDEAVDALADRLIGRTTADLNLELCARLPVHVVTRGIGMDGDDALEFREHLVRGTVHGRHLPEAERAHAQAEVARMLQALITARRTAPGDDVVTALIQNELKLPDGTSRDLTDEEIFGYCRLIMLAGGGTTWRQLGITLVALLRDYRFWEACREDRALIEAAVEESARWMPTDPTFPRLMMQDVEVDGVLLPKGARIDLCVGSANRDPKRWDDPDRYDIFRKPQYHVGFGLGPHQCLGMNVAKQEMVSAINALMDRFPNMHLDPDAPLPELRGGLEQRGMTAVPVRLA